MGVSLRDELASCELRVAVSPCHPVTLSPVFLVVGDQSSPLRFWGNLRTKRSVGRADLWSLPPDLCLTFGPGFGVGDDGVEEGLDGLLGGVWKFHGASRLT